MTTSLKTRHIAGITGPLAGAVIVGPFFDETTCDMCDVIAEILYARTQTLYAGGYRVMDADVQVCEYCADSDDLAYEDED